jgi:hypothetical protein
MFASRDRLAGERMDSFRLNASGHTYTLWNVDQGQDVFDSNLYGSHAFYLEMRNGLAHGVVRASQK